MTKEPLHWNNGPVRSVAFSPGGRLLASGDERAVQVIDLASRRRLHTFRGSALFTGLAFSPDGRTLASASGASDARVQLWDVATGREEPARTGHTGDILGLSFDPAGGRVATASWDGTARLWDVARPGEEARVFDFRRTGQAHCAAFSPEGRHLAVGLQDGTVAILRVRP